MFNFITLLKNIKYLCSTNLREQEKEQMYQTLLRTIDLYKYEIREDEFLENDIRVLEYTSTLELLEKHPKSFCRLGDGEIALINGHSISFQDYDKRLADYLLKILKAKDDRFYIGLNYNYFHSTQNMNDYNRKFYLVEVKPIRDFIIKNWYTLFVE